MVLTCGPNQIEKVFSLTYGTHPNSPSASVYKYMMLKKSTFTHWHVTDFFRFPSIRLHHSLSPAPHHSLSAVSSSSPCLLLPVKLLVDLVKISATSSGNLLLVLLVDLVKFSAACGSCEN